MRRRSVTAGLAALVSAPAWAQPASTISAAFDGDWRLLHAPPFGGDYAMGWVKRGDGRRRNGANMLWRADVLVDPVRGLAGAAVTNDGAPIAQQESAPRAVQGALAAAA